MGHTVKQGTVPRSASATDGVKQGTVPKPGKLHRQMPVQLSGGYYEHCAASNLRKRRRNEIAGIIKPVPGISFRNSF